MEYLIKKKKSKISLSLLLYSSMYTYVDMLIVIVVMKLDLKYFFVSIQHHMYYKLYIVEQNKTMGT